MSDSHSTAPLPSGKPAEPAKPAKPPPDFPLCVHAAGYWVRRIRGQVPYFGKWDDPDGALKKYQEQREDSQAGRKVRSRGAGANIKELVNRFVSLKKSRPTLQALDLRLRRGPVLLDHQHPIALLLHDRFGHCFRQPIASMVAKAPCRQPVPLPPRGVRIRLNRRKGKACLALIQTRSAARGCASRTAGNRAHIPSDQYQPALPQPLPASARRASVPLPQPGIRRRGAVPG